MKISKSYRGWKKKKCCCFWKKKYLSWFFFADKTYQEVATLMPHRRLTWLPWYTLSGEMHARSPFRSSVSPESFLKVSGCNQQRLAVFIWTLWSWRWPTWANVLQTAERSEHRNAAKPTIVYPACIIFRQVKSVYVSWLYFFLTPSHFFSPDGTQDVHRRSLPEISDGHCPGTVNYCSYFCPLDGLTVLQSSKD